MTPHQAHRKSHVQSVETLASIVEAAAAHNERMARHAPQNSDSSPAVPHASSERQVDSREVFIVHGRDEAAKEQIARFLEKMDLKPVILYSSQTRAEQLSKNSNIMQKMWAAPLCFLSQITVADWPPMHLKATPEDHDRMLFSS